MYQMTTIILFGFLIQIFAVDFGRTVSVLDYGAVADNTTDCSAAFQAAIDDLTSRSEGGELWIPDGRYALRSTIRLKPKVSIYASKAAAMRAAAPLNAMIDTDVGNGSMRLRHQSIRGGIWDGACNADRVFLLRDFNGVSVEDALLKDCQVAYIDVDGTGASATCFELMVRNISIERTTGAGAYPSGCVGIRAGLGLSGVSDSHFSDVIISGVERGISGGFWISKFDRVHVYGYGPLQGQICSAFYMQGGNNQFVECQVDNPKYEGWYISEDGTQIAHSCITYSSDSWLDDGVAVCVYVDGDRNVVVDNNRWNVHSASKRMAAEFDGDLGKLRAQHNLIRSGNIIVPYGDTGPGALEAYVDFTTVAGTSPTVNGSLNVASVVRTGDADYTIVFSRPIFNGRYGVNVDLRPTQYPADLIWVLREKTKNSVRLQFKENGSFVRPESVTLQCIGGAF